jgi:hypothetical protein
MATVVAAAENTSLTPPVNTYKYSTGLVGKNIRLLTIEAGTGNIPIKCSISIVALDESVIYNALSYTWGLDAPKHTISCNGQRLDISENLYSALLQIREDGRTEPMWIDAICINQSDSNERTAQVKMMQEIYENAQLVIAWLGNASETDSDGFALMKTIYERCGPPSLADAGNPVFLSTDALGLPGMDDPVWRALCKVLYKPYFFRVWIIQEIIAARSCIIQCGNLVIDRHVILAVGILLEQYHWLKDMVSSNILLPNTPQNFSETFNLEYVKDALGALKDLSTQPADMATYYSLRELYFLSAMIRHGQPPSILQLLVSTRMFKATDPRDKIFALVGLASDVDSNFIDYNLSVADVQIRLAKRCMRNPECPGTMLLSYVDQGHHSHELPSWVPDWTSGGPVQTGLSCSFYKAKDRFSPAQCWNTTTNNVGLFTIAHHF